MYKINKKAKIDPLITIIIALAVAIIIISFASRLTELTRKKGGEDVCRFSVLLNSGVKKATFSLRGDPVIHCTATPYKAKEKYTEDDDKDSIAKQLDDCWYKMGEGKLAVFGRDFMWGLAHCIVCSEFTTNNDILLADINEELVKKVPEHDKTKKLDGYLSYKGQKFVLEAFDELGGKETMIKKSDENNYLVVFRRYAPSVLGKESQKVFIVHEDGLSKIKDGGYEGFKCNQLLWEKWMD